MVLLKKYIAGAKETRIFVLLKMSTIYFFDRIINIVIITNIIHRNNNYKNGIPNHNYFAI